VVEEVIDSDHDYDQANDNIDHEEDVSEDVEMRRECG
jgi:hypothetical protein